MEEGTFELVLEGSRGIFPRGKGKGGCSHQKRPELSRIVSGTLRRVEGTIHKMKAQKCHAK